eukprot:scaffold106635_cov68-Phaeocystis_antarctica.AAC.5
MCSLHTAPECAGRAFPCIPSDVTISYIFIYAGGAAGRGGAVARARRRQHGAHRTAAANAARARGVASQRRCAEQLRHRASSILAEPNADASAQAQAQTLLADHAS